MHQITAKRQSEKYHSIVGWLPSQTFWGLSYAHCVEDFTMIVK